MLRVYDADISALSEKAEGLPLSAYRMAQLSACRSPQRRRQGIGAELLLIHALRSLKGDFPLPLFIEKEPGGKPFLSDSGLFFSLSHSENTVACALSENPVGIDLERERDLREAVLRRCFSEGEQRWILESASPSAAFTELWTRKESYLKATGEGLRSLHSLDLLRPPPDASFFHTYRAALQLSVCVLGAPAEPDVLESVDLTKLSF